MNNKTLWSIVGIALIAVVIGAIATERNTEIKQFSSTSQLESFLEKNTDSNYESNTLQAGALEASSDSKSSGESSQAPSATGGSDRFSTTNVQVVGVDEPDFVKNDGTYIYIARDSTLTIVRAEGLEQLSKVEIDGYITNMFVNGNQLILFGIEQGSYYECADCEIAVGAPVEAKVGADEGTTSSDAMPDEEGKLVAPDYYYKQPRSFVTIYDISDRTNPKAYKELFYDGNYRDARMVGGYVYLIANQPLIKNNDELDMPRIMYSGEETTIAASEIAYFPVSDYGYQLTTIFALELDDLDKDLVRESFLTGYTQTLYMSSNALYLTAPKYVPYQTYEQRILDEVMLPSLNAETRDKAEQALDKTENIWEKNEIVQVVIADYYNTLPSDEKESFQKGISQRMAEFQEDWRNEMQKTVIHKIAVSANDISYTGKAEVPGSPLNQFSMDEYNGYLRIATTTDSWFGGGWGMPWPALAVAEDRAIGVAASDEALIEKGTPDTTETIDEEEKEVPIEETMPVPDTPWVPEMITERETSNNVFVLDENMNIVGALENLAKGERIYSARFIGDRAYLVTFKQIDPLFVIDLSVPSDPKVLGELKIPGYSTYLHPFDENTLIGIGQDSSGDIDEGGFMAAIPEGVKIGLFDVSDPENPREIDSYVIGDRGSYSDALYDHKAFLFDAENGLLVLPINVQEKAPGKAQGIPEEQFWYPTTTTFQGAYIFKLTKENGIGRIGVVTHLTASEQLEMENAKSNTDYYYPPYEAAISRSLYIGNTLYTVSQRNLQANDLITLSFIKRIELPQQSYIYGYADGGESAPGFNGVDSTDAVDPEPSTQ